MTELNAEAIVRALDRVIRERDRAAEEAARLTAQLQTWREGSVHASQERERLLKQIWAVENLHTEAQRTTCGDGCCHEGLGHCSYDNEPYPCKTIQALEGPSEPEPS